MRKKCVFELKGWRKNVQRMREGKEGIIHETEKIGAGEESTGRKEPGRIAYDT